MSDKTPFYSISWCCPNCGSFENDKEAEGKSLTELFCGQCGTTYKLIEE